MADEFENEVEMIDGYKVESSVWVGNKRIVYGVCADESNPMRYIQCIVTNTGLFGRYEGYTSDDYFETMKAFADSIKAEAVILESERRAIGMADPSCLTSNYVEVIDGGSDITCRVVAIQEKYLSDGCKDISHQLFYVDSGFGAVPNSRGNACFAWNMYTRKRTRIERYAVLGIVPDENLPDFAKKTLDDIRTGNLKDELPKTQKGEAR